MHRRDGGPAFPVSWEMGGEMVANPGMSLRDYFAIHSDISNYDFGSVREAAKFIEENAPDENDIVALMEFSFKVMAQLRYRMADAMLEAREAEGETTKPENETQMARVDRRYLHHLRRCEDYAVEKGFTTRTAWEET